MAKRIRQDAGGTNGAETQTPPTEDQDSRPAPGEQLELIDQAHPRNKELLRLARKVKRLDKERSEAQDKADEARAELRELMKECNLKHYAFGDCDITLKPGKELVSVKKRKTEEGDGGDENESEE